jgi:hypothetical protein
VSPQYIAGLVRGDAPYIVRVTAAGDDALELRQAGGMTAE